MQNNITLLDDFSDKEKNLVQIKLWEFLYKRTKKYTMGDSSSIPIEKAQGLFTSICFTLEEYLNENNSSPKILLANKIEDIFKDGLKIIEGKIKEGKSLWQEAFLKAPKIENISYKDTLKTIDDFF